MKKPKDKGKKVDAILNEIIEIISNPTIKGSDPFEGGFEGYNSPYNEGQGFSVFGENVTTFNRLLNEIYIKMNVEKKYLCGFKFFKKVVVDSLFKGEISEVLIKQTLDSYTRRESHYLYKIYGLELDDNIVKFGRYKFLKKDYLHEYIESTKTKVNENDFTLFDNEKRTDYIIIDIPYVSIDSNYGNEKTLIVLKDVINLLYYSVGSQLFDSRYFIDTKPSYAYFNDVFIFTDGIGSTSGSKITRKDKTLKITDGTSKSAKRYIDIISKDDLSEISSRVKTAMLWIGISLQEQNKTIAFTEVMFALESLLKYDDDIISKSVTAQLSETVALLIGDTYDERVAIESKIKNHYKNRSKVVHSGALVDLDYEDVLGIVYKCIGCFMNKEPYDKMNSMDDLLQQLKHLKYDCR